ncbi:hypothetical protein HHI36_002130 [Cryptolaemus montrouzieri]|uniref:Uncharacterized protein n=1 Tax=Cryptolaemus montrouzieri TaxID=559131 RepID=A0ABD2PAC2_9CUCU
MRGGQKREICSKWVKNYEISYERDEVSGIWIMVESQGEKSEERRIIWRKRKEIERCVEETIRNIKTGKADGSDIIDPGTLIWMGEEELKLVGKLNVCTGVVSLNLHIIVPIVMALFSYRVIEDRDIASFLNLIGWSLALTVMCLLGQHLETEVRMKI